MAGSHQSCLSLSKLKDGTLKNLKRDLTSPLKPLRDGGKVHLTARKLKKM